jgi:type IV pilus assembly protein PilC
LVAKQEIIMSQWVWEARNRAGETQKGVMEAESADAVQNRLKSQNFTPLKVKKKPLALTLPSIGKVITPAELVVFIRQFATMIDAGLPLVQALDILASQGTNKRFNAVLKDVKSTVEGGSTFSEALRRHPKIFDELFVNLVAAGEMGGILDTILNRLGVYIEKNVKLKRQVKGALVYPVSVLMIAIIILIIMFTYVVPTFEKMFTDFGGTKSLPAMTQIVINLSHTMVTYLPYIVGVGITGFVSISASFRIKNGKRFWHWLALTVPLIGPTMRKIAVARFTRTLGTLLSSGVPILEALSVVAKTAGNVIIETAIMQSAEKILAGSSMSEPLAETKVFPGMVVQMISVGEQTGALDQMLNKIADFYEEEVDVAVAALTSAMEPLMMVGIGGMVGFILISMYLPIFSLAGVVGSGGQ